jgi:L-aspartate oxidase
MIDDYYWRHTVTRDLLELRNIALFAELLAESALHRRESRGGHYREDYPERSPESRDTVLRRGRVHPRAPRTPERSQG